MAKRQHERQPSLAVGSTVMLLLQTISAARIHAYPSATPALDLDTLPVITAAPSPDLVSGRLEKRTAVVNSCATAASAVCKSIANGGALSSSSAAPGHSGGGLDGDTSSRGSGNENSGSGGLGNGNSAGSGSSSSSSSNGLSSGAIAGVAIGAVAVVVIACALLYYFWMQRKRHREITNANMASQTPAGNGPPPMSLTVPVPDGTGKPPAGVATSTTPVGTHHYPSSLPSASPYSSAVNTASPASHGSPPVYMYPGTTELAGDGWQQGQQASLNSPPQGVGVHGPQNRRPEFHQVHAQAIPPLQPQEMFSDPHTRNELHQPNSNGVYEMSAKQGS